MAANVSQHKRRTAAMTSPVAHFAGWSFMATCPVCRDRRYVPVNRLLHDYGGQHQVQAIVNRLRCAVTGCGKPPTFVRLQSKQDGMPGPPIIEVILVGPGAY